MSIDDPTDLFEATLDDYLVGLANGIRQAQAQLNAIVVDGPPGQPAIGYQLPRVDFELKLAFALSHAAPAPGAAPTVRLVARAPQPVAGGFTAEGTSTLRGSFVAVPIAAQRPSVVLSLAFRMRHERDIELEATVVDALGEPQAGVEVEFNVDRDRSLALGGEAAEPLAEDTRVEPAVAVTDDAGHAVANLVISEREPAHALVAVVVDALGVSETLLVSAPDPDALIM
ncbi:MAG: hypothetical protein H6703_02530 [Myxococcales bacterium]|nr:hypothetical protein [Myxococcales bacterium]MCB9541310.1 hypothetical protein [Myxococcales bacterium]MCB9553594.1 hypothetical protein [Myxococcales bacterium]